MTERPKTQLEIDRERTKQADMRRRADRYHERVWRDHAITTGKYKGDQVPGAVMLKMREARSAHLLGDLDTFNPSGPLGEIIAAFPYRGKHQDRAGRLVWRVHADGCLTIGDDPADSDF